MSFSIGQIVGDYQIVEVLGAGGMGTVYKVRHLISDRLEAIKLILPELTENPELMERFMREIKMQARLSHPNIASLHNAVRQGDQLLMVMEFVEGSTLHSVLRRGRMELGMALDIVEQVLSALEYAHMQGIVHRDIKPANIMLTARSRQVKLMDFGIARSVSEQTLTRTGSAVGSVFYMSPEQVQGSPADGRADLYSVGVVLYEMATGVRPIVGEGTYSVMNAHLSTIPRAPSSLNPQIPEMLSLAILKALEKRPELRFQTAREFSNSLAALRTRFGSEGRQQLPQQFAETELATPSVRPERTAHTPGTPPVATTKPGQTTENLARFDAEKLEKLVKELAVFVGPMAKVLVGRAAKKVQTLAQLYDALATEVPEGAERKKFLAKRPSIG